MDGVTILETSSNVGLYLVATMSAALFIFLLGIVIHCFKGHEYAIGVFLSILTVVLITAFGIMLHQSFNTHQYKVTVDESVSFVEFMDNYEVISRDGKIFTVEAIDNE